MQQNNQISYEIVTSGKLIGFKDRKLLINKQELNNQINQCESKIIERIEKEKPLFFKGSNELFKDQDFTRIAWEKDKQLRINEEKWDIGKKVLEDIINEIFKDTDFKFDTNKILLDCGLEPGRKDLARFEKKLRENPLINHPEVVEMKKIIQGQKPDREIELVLLMRTIDFVSYSKSKNQQQNIKKGVENATNSKNVVKNTTKKEEEPCCKLY